MVMASPDGGSETLTVTTLNLLDSRLRRLEFLLGGTRVHDEALRSENTGAASSNHGAPSISARLEKLTQELDSLRSAGGIEGQLVRLVNDLYSRVPELFQSSTPLSVPITSDVAARLAIVLSHATVFPETASRLSSLQSLQVPAAHTSQKLLDLQPRLDAALVKQTQLEFEAEDLRERSARCLEWWVKIGVVGMGELWEDWEGRLYEVDRALRKMERKKADEAYG